MFGYAMTSFTRTGVSTVRAPIANWAKTAWIVFAKRTRSRRRNSRPSRISAKTLLFFSPSASVASAADFRSGGTKIEAIRTAEAAYVAGSGQEADGRGASE